MTNTTPPDTRFDVACEQRGAHWVAWLAGEDGKPLKSVIVVGSSREEAENRARQWSRDATALGYL